MNGTSAGGAAVVGVGDGDSGEVAARVVDGVRIAPGTTHWRAKKFRDPEDGSIGKEDCTTREGALEAVEWPIEEFSAETVRDRWGGGLYEIILRRIDPSHVEPSRGLGVKRIRVAPRPGDKATSGPTASVTALPSVRSVPAAAACLVCGAPLVGRFCASCGTPAGGLPAPSPSPPPAASSPRDLDIFMAGQAHMLKMMETVEASVRARVAAETERYKIDVEARLERERIAAEREREEARRRDAEHKAALERAAKATERAEKQAAEGDRAAVLRAELDALKSELATMRDGDGDEGDDEPRERTSETAAKVEDWLDVGAKLGDLAEPAGKVVEKVVAPVVGRVAEVVVGAVERATKAASGGGS